MRSFFALIFILAMTILLTSATPTKVKVHKDPLPKGFAETEDSNVSVTDTVFAYDFETKTMDGKTLKLVDYRGKWVFIDFFATW